MDGIQNVNQIEFDRNCLESIVNLASSIINKKQGGPFVAGIYKDNTQISIGWNQVLFCNDPTSHAEIVAIRAACKKLNYFQLQSCTLYSSCQPCPMCWGAIQWARIEKVIYAANCDEAASVGFDDRLFHNEFNIPMKERYPKGIHMPIKNRLKPFTDWQNMSDKTEY